MKKFTVLATIMAAGLFASNVNATTIKIDASTFLGNASGTNVTNPFNFLTTNAFSPVSIYTPTTAGVVSNFDAVKDVGTAFIGQLNPLNFPGEKAGFGATWGMKLSWNLLGFAVVQGSNYLGSFTGGSVGLDICTGATFDVCSNVMNIGINGSGFQGGGIGIEIYGKVTSVASGVFYDKWDRDFASNLANGEMVFALASSDISGLNNTPTAANCNGVSAANAGDLCRTTNLNSVEVAFAVPEPTSLAILGLGLMGMGFTARRKNKATA